MYLKILVSYGRVYFPELLFFDFMRVGKLFVDVG